MALYLFCSLNAVDFNYNLFDEIQDFATLIIFYSWANIYN